MPAKLRFYFESAKKKGEKLGQFFGYFNIDSTGSSKQNSSYQSKNSKCELKVRIGTP